MFFWGIWTQVIQMSQGHVHWVHEFLKCVFHGQFQTMKEAQNEANPWVIFLKQPDKTRVCTTVYSCTIWQQQQKKTSWEQVPGNVVWKLSEWLLYKTRGILNDLWDSNVKKFHCRLTCFNVSGSVNTTKTTFCWTTLSSVEPSKGLK